MSGRSPHPHGRGAGRLAGATIALLLAGCATTTPGGPMTTPGPDGTQPPSPSALPSLTPLPPGKTIDPAPSLSPSMGPPPTGPVPEEVLARPEVTAAIAAEAERTGVPDADVAVVGYSEVTWRDGSLGCPQPGMAYTQALVPGDLLVLEVDGRRASYHAARGATFAYCANPVLPSPGAVDPNA